MRVYCVQGWSEIDSYIYIEFRIISSYCPHGRLNNLGAHASTRLCIWARARDVAPTMAGHVPESNHRPTVCLRVFSPPSAASSSPFFAFFLSRKPEREERAHFCLSSGVCVCAWTRAGVEQKTCVYGVFVRIRRAYRLRTCD